MSEPNSYSTSIHHSPMRSEIPLSVLLHPNADSSSLSLHLPTSSTSAPDSTSDFMPSSPSLSPSLYHHSLSLNSSCSSPSFPLCIPPHTSSIQGSQGGSFTSLVTPRPFYVFNRASYDLMLQCLVKGTSPKLKEIMEADPQQGLPTKRWKRLQGNLKIYNAPDDPLHPKLVWKSCFQNLIIEPIEEWIHIFHKIHTHKNERNQVRHLRIQKCLEMLTRQYQYRRSRCGFTMEDFRRFYTECSCQQPIYYSTTISCEPPSALASITNPSLYPCIASSSSPSNSLLPQPILTSLPPMMDKDPSFPYTPTSPWTTTTFHPSHFTTLSSHPNLPSTTTNSSTSSSYSNGCMYSSPESFTKYTEDRSCTTTPAPSDLLLPPLLLGSPHSPTELRKPFTGTTPSTNTFLQHLPKPTLCIDTTITHSMTDTASSTGRVRLPSIHSVLQAYPSPKVLSDYSYPF